MTGPYEMADALRRLWADPAVTVDDRWRSLEVATPPHDACVLVVRALCPAARRVISLTRRLDRTAVRRAIESAERWTHDPRERTAHEAIESAGELTPSIGALQHAMRSTRHAAQSARADSTTAYGDGEAYLAAVEADDAERAYMATRGIFLAVSCIRGQLNIRAAVYCINSAYPKDKREGERLRQVADLDAAVSY